MFQTFVNIGKAIYQTYKTYQAAINTALFIAQGVASHKAAMKAKATGADILLQKYGTGKGIPVIYGTRRVAGTVVYMETQNNRELYVVYAIAAHEVDSFDLESIQLDGRTVKDTKIYRQGYDISDGTRQIDYDFYTGKNYEFNQDLRENEAIITAKVREIGKNSYFDIFLEIKVELPDTNILNPKEY